MSRLKADLIFCLIVFCLFLFVSHSWGETVEVSLKKNTISRQFDHIVVKGSDLKQNLNKHIPSMRLYAFRNGKMQPIPYQIDEITADGDWVLPYKSPYLNKKQEAKSKLIREDSHLVMDENDELVFMITDIGDKADPDIWPESWSHADEIILTDPITNDQGWVYLFSFCIPPERSPVDYVEYRLPENKKDKIYTDMFTLGFSHEIPITQDYLDFKDGKNLLDRMKVRLFFRFFRFIKFQRNENDMESLVWQYKDGPIRVIRMVRSSIRLIGNLQSPQVNSETLYYRNVVLVPFRLKILYMPKGIVNEAYLDSGGDYRNLYGWKVRLNTDEKWLAVDGKMDEVEKNVKVDGGRWHILKGPGKAQIVFIHFAEDYPLETKYHYIDDDATEYPPEFHPAQVPYIGWHVSGLGKLQGYSTLHIKILCFYVNEEYSEEELLRAMNIVNSPIQIKSHGFNSNT